MIEFTSKYPAVISIALIAASYLIAFLSFRNRALPLKSKILFTVIRTAAIFLLLFLFLQPAIVALTKHSGENSDIILIDDSRSNSLAITNGKTKSAILKEILNSSKPDENKTRIYTFASELKRSGGDKFADSLSSDGYATDMTAALKQLRTIYEESTLRSVTVISDGIINSGTNPVSEAKLFGCPFNTIALGDSVQQKDVLVKRVDHNDKVFTGTPFVIKAPVEAYGFNGQTLTVTLLREGIEISSKSLSVTSENFSGIAEFTLTESEPGIVHYSVTVKSIDGEITTKNNRIEFLAEFMNNETNILVISGGPSYDNGDIESIIGRIRNYKVSVHTLKTASSFYEGEIDQRLYPKLSAVFLLNFPSTNTDGRLISSIAENVSRYKIPLVFFAGKNTDYQKLASFENSLPFSVQRGGNSESQVSLQLVKQNEPGETMSNLNELGSLPSVYKNTSGIIPKSGTETILIDKSGGEPMLITRSTNQNRSTAFLGYGVWKWSLNPRGSEEKSLEKLLVNMVNMSLDKDKKQRVMIDRNPDIYDYLQEPVITVKVYDEDYNLTRNATVKAKIKGRKTGTTKEVTLSAENNVFIAKLGKLPPDDYDITADAEFGSLPIGSARSRFLVDSLNTEFLVTKSDYALMRSLADNTWGTFYSTASMPGLTEVLDKSNAPQVSDSELRPAYKRFNLWENKYLLFAIVFLFSIEWFWKKRKNVP